jgi:fucose 4-O-acetylase-like acetyltransferase
MDVLRGVAIVLVLAWHAPAIPALLGYSIPDWLMAPNRALGPFRMPTLMFLSGILLPASLNKPMKDYLWGKVRMLAWPYLVWSLVHLLVYGSAWPIYHPRAWIATGYLWFLFFIGVYYVLAPLIRRAPAYIPPLVLLATSIPVEPGLSKMFLYFGGFFFAGYLAGLHKDALQRLVQSRRVVLACLVAACSFAVVSVSTNLAYQGQYALLSGCGIIVAIAWAQRIESRRWAGPLAHIGRHSLIFYTSHFPIMLGVVATARAVHANNVALMAGVGFVVALAAGFALVKYRDPLPIRWLFRGPDWLGPSKRTVPVSR